MNMMERRVSFELISSPEKLESYSILYLDIDFELIFSTEKLESYSILYLDVNPEFYSLQRAW